MENLILTDVPKHERFRLVPGYGESFFTLDSESLDQDIEFIKKSKIENLILNGRDQFRERDLEFLKLIARQIRWLVITPPAKTRFDYGGLEYCTHLKTLKINNRGDGRVDVSGNVDLTSLDVDDSSMLDGLDSNRAIENLILNRPPSELLTEDHFGNKTRLRYLALSGSKLDAGFGFLQKSAPTDLRLFYCSSVNLAGISKLGLRCFGIEACRRVENRQNLWKARSLRELRIIDSFTLESTADLDGLLELERLFILGKSYFEDGDLSALKNRFRVFSFDDKRHYNVTYKDFSSQFLLN